MGSSCPLYELHFKVISLTQMGSVKMLKLKNWMNPMVRMVVKLWWQRVIVLACSTFTC